MQIIPLNSNSLVQINLPEDLKFQSLEEATP